MIEVQRGHASTLISLLHPEASTRALIEITGLMPKSRPAKRYYTDVSLAVESAIELNGLGYNTFVNVNPRHEMAAFETSVSTVTALALDLQPERVPIAEAERRLVVAGLPPTLIAVSGYGAHFYLKLSAPADPQRAKLIWERLCKYTTSDPIFSINRIMRLTGTLNRKKVPPIWCYVARTAFEYQYDVEEINLRLDHVGAAPLRPPAEGIPVPVDPPEDWADLRDRLSEGTRFIIDSGERNAYSEAQVSRSEADWVVVCGLVRAGATDEMIAWVYEKQPVGLLKYREAGARYLKRTIERARQATAERVEHTAPAHAKDSYRAPRGSSSESGRYYTRMGR